MTWILRVLTFIYVFPLLKSSATVYEAKENDNITIGWDIQTKTDINHANMIFRLLSDPPKVLYEMIGGNDILDRPHQQFAGRVQCDKDALREGRVRLHLFRVTAEDSGNYTFDLAANYDRNLGKWIHRKFELFVLNITSDGANANLSGNTPGQADSPDAKDQPGGPEHRDRRRHGLIASLVATFVLVVFCAVYRGPQARKCNVCPWIT